MSLLTAHLMQFGTSLAKFYHRSSATVRAPQSARPMPAPPACSPALIRWPGGTARLVPRAHRHTGCRERRHPRDPVHGGFQLLPDDDGDAELEMEQSGGSGGGGEYGGEDEDDEETQLRRAIELSMAEAGGGGESGLLRGGPRRRGAARPPAS